MDMNALVVAVSSMGGMGALFAIGLALANKKLHVEEDPRISALAEALPGANCGGCGFPGCAAFAENIVQGKASVSGCPVATVDVVEELAQIMGVQATAGERMIARVMCQGGLKETAPKGIYLGATSCISAQLSGGGDKMCEFGCMGYGDCVETCPFDAMYMNDNGLPVIIDEKCTGCGNCVRACPRDIIELHPESHRLFVLCKNQDDAKYARSVCTAVCFGCGQCIKAVKEGEMAMEGNLAKINYDIYGKTASLPTEKCQTGALAYLGDDGKFHSIQEEKETALSSEA